MTRSTRIAITLVLGLSGGMMFAGHTAAAWYVGVGGGLSKLSPDTTASPFTLDEEQSQAATAYLGLDINDWFSAEAAFTDLGAAGLSGEQEIAYTAASVGGIAYVLKNRGMNGRQSGLSGYLRLGVNSITNESEILLNEADNTAVWFGAGVQYPIGERLGLRAELTSYDGDAQVAMASIYWRSKSDRNELGGIIAGGQRSDSSAGNANGNLRDNGYEQVEAFDGYDKNGSSNATAGNGFDTEIIDPLAAGVLNNGDVASSAVCSSAAPNEPTDASGCALFTGVVEGVEFQVASSLLTSDSEYLLESLALSLNNYPALLIEVQVHTEAYAEPGRAMRISRERVVAVARFLAAQGVDVKRLRARAFGSAKPRFDTNAPQSRRLNNRVVLRVL